MFGRNFVFAALVCVVSLIGWQLNGIATVLPDTVNLGSATTKRGTVKIPKTHATPCDKVPLEKLRPYMKSQSKEDSILLQYLSGLCGGTYIEMGGLDGVRFSNSFVFNKSPDLGQWKGLMVELTPDSFAKLRVNRPHEIATVHAAVCQEETKLHYVAKDGHKAAVSGVWEFADPAFRANWWPELNGTDGLPEVDCKPLDRLLDEHVGVHNPRVYDAEQDLYYFDFFSLDVEGAEWSVLQSVDWDRTAFGIIFLEADGNNQRQEVAERAFLEGQGYMFVGSINRSNWFINKHFAKIYGHL